MNLSENQLLISIENKIQVLYEFRDTYFINVNNVFGEKNSQIEAKLNVTNNNSCLA